MLALRLKVVAYQRRGVTIVETLLAITLIAGLVAALVPALATSRNSAQKLSCAINARSITLGMIAHANDDPAGRFTNDDTVGSDDLTYLYRGGYLTAPDIAICPETVNRLGPASTHPSGTATTSPAGLDQAARHAHDTRPGHSYETFHHVNPGQFPDFSFDRLRLPRRDDVLPPRRSYIVLDSDNDPSGGGWNHGRYGYNNLPDRATNNHRDTGLNVAFLDGSARFVAADQWIEVKMRGGHLDGNSIDMVRAKRYFEPRLQWGLRTDGGPGLRYWIE